MPPIDWMHLLAIAVGAVAAHLMQRFGAPVPASSALPVLPTPTAKAQDIPAVRVILVRDDAAPK